MKLTAARLVRHALESIGVEYTFGIPGVHNIELYDELRSSETISPVLVTHEAGAAFMADAIGRIGDSIGALAIVPAAGITHAMSGVGEAYLDGIPMLIISGGIRTDMAQSFQLHDVDQQAGIPFQHLCNDLLIELSSQYSSSCRPFECGFLIAQFPPPYIAS